MSIGDGGKKSTNNLGIYDDLSSCESDITSPSAGNYFMNSDTSTIWYYSGSAWVNSGGTSSGDMLSSIYDPSNIAANAFLRSNHTGTQSISTIADLQDSLDDKQNTVTGGVSNVLTSNFLLSKALVSSSSGKAVSSSTTSTEIGYLSGVTSPIQAQIDAIDVTEGYTGGTVADGDIGQKVTETGYQKMEADENTFSLSMPLTAGVWVVYGQIKWHATELTEGGWLKACLSLTENSFTNYNSTIMDKGNVLQEVAGSLFPLYVTITEDTDVYMNLARENSTYTQYMYLNFLAVRIA